MSYTHVQPEVTGPRPDRRAITGITRLAVLFAAIVAIIAGSLVGSAQPSEAATSSSLTTLRAGVVKLTNSARKAAGCRYGLKVSYRLTRAAQSHANSMARYNYFSHTSWNGTSWDDRIRHFGWRRPGGENIAYGYSTPLSVVRAWLASPGHRRNIRNCNFRYIGVGFNTHGNYWVQDFGY